MQAQVESFAKGPVVQQRTMSAPFMVIDFDDDEEDEDPFMDPFEEIF